MAACVERGADSWLVNHVTLSLSTYPEHPHPVQVGSDERRSELTAANTSKYTPEIAVLVHIHQTLGWIQHVLRLSVNSNKILQDNAPGEEVTCTETMDTSH